MDYCVFCELETVLTENDLAKAFYDNNPVSEGHVLIVPKRHVEDYFALTTDEKNAIDDLLLRCKVDLDDRYTPAGYNIGINCGKDAGQTIFHCHVHLIPRYIGDVADPTGGVRGVIPEKQNYKS